MVAFVMVLVTTVFTKNIYMLCGAKTFLKNDKKERQDNYDSKNVICEGLTWNL